MGPSELHSWVGYGALMRADQRLDVAAKTMLHMGKSKST